MKGIITKVDELVEGILSEVSGKTGTRKSRASKRRSRKRRSKKKRRSTRGHSSLRVHRKGYWRGPYSYRRGGKLIRVKRHRVPATSFAIKDRGAPGRGKKVIGGVKKGALKKFGYSTSKPAAARHRALSKAVKRYGADRVWHQLHAITVWNKRRKGSTAYRSARADRNWIAKNYKISAPKKAIKKWKSMSPRARARAMPG